MIENSIQVSDDNVSLAWAKAFMAVMKPGVEAIMPLTVTVTGLNNGYVPETAGVREALDDCMTENGVSICATVASTIFPRSLWNPALARDALRRRYLNILPKLKKHRANMYGLYFERLVAFGPRQIDQLDHIITTYKRGNHRRSALQAAVFDPAADHSHQRQRGFPCMQQLTFVPFGDDELAITGFYATQWLFERAYGNYLGLCHLGQFMAHELGLRLSRMNCVAGVALRGDTAKERLTRLARHLEGVLARARPGSCALENSQRS